MGSKVKVTKEIHHKHKHEKVKERVKIVYVKCDHDKVDKVKKIVHQQVYGEITKKEASSSLAKLFGRSYSLMKGLKELEESPVVDGEKAEVKSTLSTIQANAYQADQG